MPLVRLLRPELAAIPHPLRAAQVRCQLWSMFARPERLDPAAAEVAADEFCRAYRSRSARVAFFASLRNIYLDQAYGERGLWTRLERLEPPAMFVWGDSDRLVPSGFARHVAEALPDAAPGDPRRVRPRAPGRAARAHQRPDPRDDRRRAAAPAEPGH